MNNPVIHIYTSCSHTISLIENKKAKLEWIINKHNKRKRCSCKYKNIIKTIAYLRKIANVRSVLQSSYIIIINKIMKKKKPPLEMTTSEMSAHARPGVATTICGLLLRSLEEQNQDKYYVYAYIHINFPYKTR